MHKPLQGNVSAIGALKIIALLVPALLDGLLLTGAILVFAVLAVIGGVRRGRSAVASVGLVVLLGLITAGAVYGAPWFLMQSVAGRPLFTP